MGSTAPAVRSVRNTDREAWFRLYAGYRSFYELEPDDEILERVWGWLLDDAHELNGLVAEVGGEVRGLAHHRRFASPSAGRYELYLDDLFTDPEVRGRGVGMALIAALADRAAVDGIELVSWITDERNTTARRLYDTVATAARWVTYELTPAQRP